MLRVLAFTIKPQESADTRYRIVQFLEPAERDGIHIEHRSLIGSRYLGWQMKNRRLLLRILLYPVLLLKRLYEVMFLAPRADVVWLAREMMPIGPPVLERMLLKRCKRVIFDIDDALHIRDEKMGRAIPGNLRDHAKFARLAPHYHALVCGSANLAEYYGRFASKVFVVPTVVAAQRYARCAPIPSPQVRIGWVGTPLNLDHLELAYPALRALAQRRDFRMVLIGLNQRPNWDLPYIDCYEWRLEEEMDFFCRFDIGIMPLRDTPFARGKCAFKLVQYMAAGLPAVASPVGANCEVVQHGTTGFLAEDMDQWQSCLQMLIDDAELRSRMGKLGRERVCQHYSVESAWRSYSSIFTGLRPQEPSCAVF